jgi:hypothetical protein
VGFKKFEWLGDCILKVIEPNTKYDFFKHYRDGYKAIHVIRRSNQHGSFLEVSEFHSGTRQGVIRIPKGMQRLGWVAFANFCKDQRGPSNIMFHQRPNHHQSRAVDDVSGPNKLAEGSKPKISYKDLNLNNNVSIAVENALIYTDKEC